MRPLTWSIPQFEVRCGIFTVRERVGLCMGEGGGALLGRAMLSGLHTDPDWSWDGAGLLSSSDKQARVLFLSGGLAPDFSLIQGLFSLANEAPDFAWFNGQGLVAALLPMGQAVELASHWVGWENGNHERGAWREAGIEIQAWEPEQVFSDGTSHPLPGGDRVVLSGGSPSDDGTFFSQLQDVSLLQVEGPEWIWDIVGLPGGLTTSPTNGEVAKVFLPMSFSIIAGLLSFAGW